MVAQESETGALLDELRGRRRANVYSLSIYQSIREPGPLPEPTRLVEASERAVNAIRDAADADAKFGGFMQRELWLSTLPLGRDVAQRTKKYVSRPRRRHDPSRRHQLWQPDRDPDVSSRAACAR